MRETNNDRMPTPWGRTLATAFTSLLLSLPAWAAAPEDSGIVSRFIAEDTAAVALYDPDTDHTYVVGINVAVFCTDPSAPEAIGDLPAQQVLVHDQPGWMLDRLVYRESGETYAGIWAGNTLSGDVCANMLGTPPVAEGTVRFRYRDNDLSWYSACDLSGDPNNNAGVWGVMWNGVLEDYFGQPAPFSGQYSAVWQQCDPDTFKERLHVQF